MLTLALRRAELHLAFDSSSLIASNIEMPIERSKAEAAFNISGRQARPRACSMSRVCSATRPHVSLARYCARQRARDAARLSLGANTRARASERAGGAGASGSPHRTDRACGGSQGRHAGIRVLCTKGARHSQSAWALCAAANLLAVHPPRDGVLVCTYAHTHNIHVYSQGLLETLRRERPVVLYEDARGFSKARAACDLCPHCACAGQ